MQKIFIWGTGKMAQKLFDNGMPKEVSGYVETIQNKKYFCNKKVYSYTELPGDYTAIIVANRYSDEVYQDALKQKLQMEKLIFMYPCIYVKSDEKLEWIKEILGEQNFELYCCNYGFYDKTFFVQDKKVYNSINKRDTLKIDDKILRPMVKDRYEKGGTISSYFWQDLWAAKLIFSNQPKVHYDIGSRLDGFIAHVLSFGIPVNMIDIRPLPTEIQGLHTIIDDATDMKHFKDNSIESLSALCSLEHFGLGRYGDQIDPEACFKCFKVIQEKMRYGGKLYISVPIGKERLEFNAHRIFYAKTIVDSFKHCRLLEFSCMADGKIEKNVALNKYDNDVYYRGTRFGLFYFEKK